MYMRLSACNFGIYGAFSGSPDILAPSFLSVSASLPVSRFKHIVVNYILTLFLLSAYFFLLQKVPFKFCVFLARRMATDMPLFAVKARHLFNPPHIADKIPRCSLSHVSAFRRSYTLAGLFFQLPTRQPAGTKFPLYLRPILSTDNLPTLSCTSSIASAFSQSKLLFFSYPFSILSLPRAKETVSTDLCDKVLRFVPFAVTPFRRVKP